MGYGTRGVMAGRILNRYKRHYKAAEAILIFGGYTDIGKKQKAREGRLKLQGGREAKTDKTQAARALQLAPFSSFYTMVKLYNSGVFLAFCIVQIDNGSGAAFALIH